MKTSFPKEKMRVVLAEGVHASADALFAEDGYRVERIESALSPAALADVAQDAHIIGIRSKTQIPGEVLASAPRLLAVGCFCIGTNQVDLAEASVRGVPVFNSPFSNTRSVAELTIAEIISLARWLPDKMAEMHAGRWNKSAAGAHEVRGRTLGLIGYGRIGSQVSVLAEAIGMRVLYHDVRAVLPLGNARPARSLEDLLDRSDVVSLHVPATKQTSGMIGARELSQMRAGAHLINNARGTVVDIGALAASLRSGHLGGAAVDVFPTEPEGREDAFDNELCRLSNVILTPHIGGSTAEVQRSIAEDVATKLLRFINNGSTSGAVNVPEVDLPEQHITSEDGGVLRCHRVLHFHRNVPGVLSRMHAMIAELGVNIASEYLRTDGEVGYVVLDVDPSDGSDVIERIGEIPETIRARLLW